MNKTKIVLIKIAKILHITLILIKIWNLCQIQNKIKKTELLENQIEILISILVSKWKMKINDANIKNKNIIEALFKIQE